jgi:hypothetical protein
VYPTAFRAYCIDDSTHLELLGQQERVRGTGQGVHIVQPFHASADMASEFVPATQVQFVLEAVTAVAVVVGDRMWRKLPAGGRAVYEPGPRAGSSDEGGIHHATV